MKDVIETNYNIPVDNIIESNNISSFVFEKETYIFAFFNRSLAELKELVDCCVDLKNAGLKTLIFIPNNRNSFVTKVNDDNYVLLQLIPNYKEVVDLEEIIDNNKKYIVSNKYQQLYRNKWATLWSKKLDYYEYQVHELGKDKTIILNSFGYYAGLATNAIALVNSCSRLYNPQVDHLVLAHRRIFFPNYRLNYYNPINFIFDIETRDIAEYIKKAFFYNQDALLDLVTYLRSSKISSYSGQMLFARLLYPSYYFDVYDRIMNSNANQDQLIDIIKRVDEYELFLKKAYREISKYASIEKIDWLTGLKEH